MTRNITQTNVKIVIDSEKLKELMKNQPEIHKNRPSNYSYLQISNFSLPGVE